MNAETSSVRQFIVADVFATTGTALLLGVVFLARLHSGWVLVIVGLLLCAGAGHLTALRAVDRDDADRAIVLVMIADWSMAVAVTAITTWAIHVTPLILLPPVVLAVPFLGRQRLRLMLAAAVVLTFVLTALARLQDGSQVEDELTEGERSALLLVFIPLTVGLIAFQVWQSHAGVTRQAVELQASRRRLVTATDDVRRQLERDLHDSTQQRLVAVAVQLRVVERLIPTQPERATGLVDNLVHELQETSAELRNLSHGIYPPELTHYGLPRALDVLADRSPRPTHVHTDHLLPRYRPDVEATVYFCCVEAIQNAVKHAGDDAHITITITGHDPLTLDIRDNGTGFTPAITDGHGLINMADRVGALGGTLTINSQPGHGTHLHATIPHPAAFHPSTVSAVRPVPPAAAAARSMPPEPTEGESRPSPRTTILREEMLPTVVVAMLALLATIVIFLLEQRASDLLVVVIVTAVAFSLPSIVAHRLADRWPDAAIVVFTTSYWMYAVALTYLVPWTLFITPLIVLLPVILAIPHVGARTFHRMIVALMLVAVGLTIAGRLQHGFGLEEETPSSLSSGLMMTFVPIAVFLNAFQAWRNHLGLRNQAVELQASRRRLVTATDDVRRQLERDLHDSTQQRLVAVAVQLRVVERLIPTQPERATGLVDNLVHELQETSAELRNLSHGIYPPELTHYGLPRALDVLADRSPRPTHVHTDHLLPRYRPDVEATVYFCCVEAIQNAVKHAGDDAHITITITGHDPLTLDIRDNGTGFTPATTDGHGLINMADRVGALGGTLTINSQPGHGTHLHATIPDPHRTAAPREASAA